jgi:hypothetical protein
MANLRDLRFSAGLKVVIPFAMAAEKNLSQYVCRRLNTSILHNIKFFAYVRGG